MLPFVLFVMKFLDITVTFGLKFWELEVVHHPVLAISLHGREVFLF
jgi:hypothetical protein